MKSVFTDVQQKMNVITHKITRLKDAVFGSESTDSLDQDEITYAPSIY